jgi:Uma2 family endonuclease
MVTTEQALSAAWARPHRLTVGEFERLGETGILNEDARVELIEGYLIDMAPIGSPHAGTVDWLNQTLTLALGTRALVRVQSPIVLSNDSEPQPDLLVLRPRDDYYRKTHPLPRDVILVVEIADTSLAFDRNVKLPLYARHGIPEAWLVDLTDKRLLIASGPTPDGYGVMEPYAGGTVTLKALPDAGVDLGGLFGE